MFPTTEVAIIKKTIGPVVLCGETSVGENRKHVFFLVKTLPFFLPTPKRKKVKGYLGVCMYITVIIVIMIIIICSNVIYSYFYH